MVEGISQVQTPHKNTTRRSKQSPNDFPLQQNSPPSRTSKFTSGFPAFKIDCSRNYQKTLEVCSFFCQKKPPQWSYPVAARGLLQKYLDPKLPWAQKQNLFESWYQGFTASWNKKKCLFGIPQWRMELQISNDSSLTLILPKLRSGI